MTNCTTRGGIARIKTPSSSSPTYKIIPFRCGRADCPVCQNIKRRRLIKRLRGASWPSKLNMWTITTDPSVIDPQQALLTISRRWHLVCRHLLRHYPGIRYFRVVELTQSGLPHLHVLFDRFVDWHLFQGILVKQRFGRVLHFQQIPHSRAFTYMAKYLTKTLEDGRYMRELHLRAWSASVHFLPALYYFEQGTEFEIIFYGHLEWDIPSMMKGLLRYVADGGSP